MNKKSVLIVSLIILLSLVVFVQAISVEDIDGEYTVELEKGWNLISLYAIKEETSFYEENPFMEAVYMWNRYEQEYLRLYPEKESDKFDSLGETINSLYNEITGEGLGHYGGWVNSAVWVYSSERKSYSFTTFDGPVPVEYVGLKKGWNLLTVTFEFENRKLDELRGDCNIEKAYLWNPRGQSWANMITEPFPYEVKGYGFIIKVSKDCIMGESNSSAAPSGLPSGKTDSYVLEKDFPPFIYKSSNVWSESSCDIVKNGGGCDYYSASYDSSLEGVELINAVIEVPSESFTKSDAVEGIIEEFNRTDIRDFEIEIWQGNKHYVFQQDSSSETNLIFAWVSGDYIVVMAIKDFNDAEFDDDYLEGIVSAYFDKYPSSL